MCSIYEWPSANHGFQCGLAQGSIIGTKGPAYLTKTHIFLERIANDVLSLSRIQLQILSIHPVDFELVPEVRRIVAIFTNELKMYVLPSCLVIVYLLIIMNI
jgi:hypothetical protein